MDKAKDVLKGGWHPSGDKEIHRKTWKSDLKSIAGRNRDDSSSRAQSHSSTPLASLKDPDSFGPPPKHSAYYGSQTPALPAPTASWNAPTSSSSSVPAVPTRSTTLPATQPSEPKQPAQPYRVDTTGLRTDNLPKPPVRRDGGSSVPASASSARPGPGLPARKTTGPPPVLPPRQTENPHEHTPDPPPSYGEATAAAGRLARAGVNVPDLGVGSAASPQNGGGQMGHTGQLSELQQRFARMNTGNAESSTVAPVPAAIPGAIAGRKKPPPPPPAKRSDLTSNNEHAAAPPIPMSSKPKPG